MSAHARPSEWGVTPHSLPVQAAPSRPVRLDADHREHLYTSGLSDREIDESGCFTLEHPRFGRCLIFPMYGFRRRDGVLEPLGVEYLYRPDTPRLEQRDNGTWRVRKYEREWGSRSTLFCHPDDLALLADRGIPIYVVEGVKKMLKLRAELSRTGRPGVVIHANGIWTNQRKSADGEYRLYDDWYEFPLRSRRVVLVPDSDAEPGGTTEQAWGVIAKLLEATGAVVSRTHLHNAPDGAKVGPDDHFVRGGTLDELLATATDSEPWLAPLNSAGDVVSGAEHRAIRTERDTLKARHALDRELLANRNLKHGQVRAALITLDAIGYDPTDPVRPAQKTSLEAIAKRGMPKSTLERCLSELAKADLIVKKNPVVRDPYDNSIIASQLEIAPGPALAGAKTATVPDQKPSGGPRPKCELCGRENVKAMVVHRCLDCGHVSGLDQPAEAVMWPGGASYTPEPEIIEEIEKSRRNTPGPQIGNQPPTIGDTPQTEAITLTEEEEPQIGHGGMRGGTTDARLPLNVTSSPQPRTVVSHRLDWSDFPPLQVKHRGPRRKT